MGGTELSSLEYHVLSRDTSVDAAQRSRSKSWTEILAGKGL